MNPTKPLLITLSIAALTLAGCSSHHKTARILKQDQAHVAMTLNKDFGATIVSVHDGKRIEPCLVKGANPSKHPAHLKPCDPDIDKGKLLHEETYRVSVREGSKCIIIWANGFKYKFCFPSK
ncbi:MAG: YgdI/YgdR family lipoprotein [Candidatus Thiodiazotropha sp. (ex Epidulcina cf. delphinae)]|nr:YgdI/YgdR family lipoprotein [Candidatus Thiodiazotropha sp. (ex Epidulcina cf. delphinae)]